MPITPINRPVSWHTDIILKGEISCSHEDESEHGCLLGRCSVPSGRKWPTFLKCLPAPSSGRWVIMEAASTSETSVTFYQIIQRNIPEYSHLQYAKSFRYLQEPQPRIRNLLSLGPCLDLGNYTSGKLNVNYRFKPRWVTECSIR
jgi:hypothetical protein